jgi:D-alanyl-D-alanine carboxypeptidase/D-alanyl-D-alanine-endopeptidase (penicillin-binding protein 4)
LYTAGAALALLHGEHRYETSITSTGAIKNGAVGSIVLRGHGDPSLTSDDLWAMSQELRAQGLRRVDGDLLVDQRFFDDQTTPPAFEQQPNEWAPFRAPVSAVAVNENTVTLTVRPTTAGSPASAWFEPQGFVDVEGSIETSAPGADNVILALTPNGKRLGAKLSGSVAEDSHLVRYSRRVEDPTLLAGYALRALLDRAEIKVSGEVKLLTGGAPKSSRELARHESEPLSRLLYALGKQSDNFYAEMVFKSLAGELKQRPARAVDSATLVMRWLERIGATDTGLVIKNGSGLFDANRVTAASVVGLLRAAWQDPAIQPEYLAQLAIGGVDGTLQKRFHDEKTRRAVRAKTGTLEDSAALSGYVLRPAGKPPLAFSILMNKVPLAQARAAMDTLVELLADREWR